MLIRLRKRKAAEWRLFFFLEIARVGSNPALNDSQPPNQNCADDNDKENCELHRLAHRRHRLILRLTKSANRSVINSTIASTSQLLVWPTPIHCIPLLGGLGGHSLASRPRIVVRSSCFGGEASPHCVKVKNPKPPMVPLNTHAPGTRTVTPEARTLAAQLAGVGLGSTIPPKS